MPFYPQDRHARLSQRHRDPAHPAMREAMFKAPLGDDVFADDPR